MLSSKTLRILLGPLGSLLAIGLLLCPVSARPGRPHSPSDFAGKASAALHEELSLLSANPAYDYPMAIIVQVEHGFFMQNH